MSLSNKLAITNVDLKGKRVLIRVGLQLEAFVPCIHHPMLIL